MLEASTPARLAAGDQAGIEQEFRPRPGALEGSSAQTLGTGRINER